MDDTTKELLESQETLYAEIEALRSQLKQLSASVAMERDRVEVLDLQLNKEVLFKRKEEGTVVNLFIF